MLETEVAPPPDETALPEAEPAEDAASADAVETKAEPAAGYSFPEGYEVDPTQLAGFEAWVEETGVAPDRAQALIDLYLQGQEGQRRQALEARVAELQGWEEAARQDAVTGGADFDAKLSVARSALERYGDQELRAFLDETGVGSHPALLRLFYRVGQAAADDRFIPPGNGTAALSPEARARRLYDKTYKE
ncbi:MAG: hypothetical protein AAFY02_17675 [Pseudomonadota bacterium]